MKLKRIKKGMTLLEVIVSLAVLGIIITPIFSLTINTVKMNKKSDDKLKALAIAQEYMEYIKSPEHSLIDIHNLPSTKDGFEIEKIIEGVEKYKVVDEEFGNVKTDSAETTQNKYTLYKATIEVRKIGQEDSKPLQTLEGYKNVFE